MENSAVVLGDKLHIVIRRAFEDDLRRHFAGTVTGVTGVVVRVVGYVFIHDPNTNGFLRRPHQRTRIYSLADAGNLINVLPAEVEVEKLNYITTRDGRLVATDGGNFSLDIQEFGRNR